MRSSRKLWQSSRKIWLGAGGLTVVAACLCMASLLASSGPDAADRSSADRTVQHSLSEKYSTGTTEARAEAGVTSTSSARGVPKAVDDQSDLREGDHAGAPADGSAVGDSAHAPLIGNPFDLADDATALPSASAELPVDARNSASEGSRSTPDRSEDDALSQRLLDSALDDGSDDLLERASIEFTHAPLAGVRQLPIPAVVAPFSVVYAHLLSSQGCAECIVKWQHRETGDIELLAVRSLVPNQSRALLVTPELGWKRGEYVMSVYAAADTSNTLIGQSAILISDNNGGPEPVGPQVEFIQSLVNNGQAYSKTP